MKELTDIKHNLPAVDNERQSEDIEQIESEES
jgi:hypothetical protein